MGVGGGGGNFSAVKCPSYDPYVRQGPAVLAVGASEAVSFLFYLPLRDRARGYKTFFMLNSIEHEIFPAHRC